MTNNPADARFWIVAGSNGAGKTTCVQLDPISKLLDDVRFINPDALTLDRLKAQGFSGFADAPQEVQLPAFLECAQAVYDDLTSTLANGGAVGVETVLSTSKYRPLVEEVRRRGGFVGLVFVFLSSPELAVERVAARVKRGGHDVPADKVAARWHRSLQELSWFAARVNVFWAFDNSDSNPSAAPPLVAFGRDGRLLSLSESAHPELKRSFDRLPR